MSIRSYRTEPVARKFEAAGNGVTMEYRLYRYAYTLWATKNGVGIKLEQGSWAKIKDDRTHPEECFARGRERLTKWSPFV